ncbi:MAG: protein kinase [Acidobacteria bacterium]|nr:protein kinase [Acidobacteriota bacterium]
MIDEIISHYRILERLGAGGMGEVYKAEDLRLHRQVALKVLRDRTQPQLSAHSEESKKRFLREAQAAAALNHPNIATIYEINQFICGGLEHSFIAMEYVPGRALSEYLRTHRLSVEQAIELVLQIADALEAAHARGIVHRDVKPSNVIVMESKQIKVLDFGLAKFMPSESAANDSITSGMHSEFMQTTPGLVMGTLAYMSPEQAMGTEVDHRSDIFSLGVLLYELLSSRLPFSGENTVALIDNLLHADPPPLNQSHSQVTPELWQITRKMLEKEREQRYQNLREVRRALSLCKQYRRVYEFGPFKVDVAERLLSRGGEVIDLKPKVFDLLVLLVQNAGRLMEKDQLLQALWPDTVVEEVNLNVNVSTLRKALGESPAAPQYIETVPKRGYRFIANVTEQVLASQPEAVSPAVSPLPDGHGKTESFATQVNPQDIDTKSGIFRTAKNTARNFSLRPAPWLLAVAVLAMAASGSFWWWWFKGQARQAPSSARTIAVLPFKSLKSDNKANESDQALGLGMADALITKLGSLQHLTVRSTSTVQKYLDTQVDPLTAGRELSVDLVLEGSVQREEKMIRITARLLKVSDGSSLWAGKFDDFYTNVFALQDSISEKMTEALAMQLTGVERQVMAKRYTENTEAYQLYLQGRYYENKGSPDSLQKAVGYYLAATEKDPEYALAFADLANTYFSLGEYSNRRGMREKARAAVDKALSLDTNLSEGHKVKGELLLLSNWDWAGAERAIKHALELNPGNIDAHLEYASMLSALGRHEEAIREMELARQSDPISTYILLIYVHVLREARRYDQAEILARKVIEMEPNVVRGYRHLALVYNAQGKFSEAIAELKKEGELDGFLRASQVLGYAYARAGNRVEAEKVLQERLRNLGRAGSNYFGIALLYAGLGEPDHVFEWLEKSYQERESQLTTLNVAPEFDSLRADPRFTGLVRRIGLKP